MCTLAGIAAPASTGIVRDTLAEQPERSKYRQWRAVAPDYAVDWRVEHILLYAGSLYTWRMTTERSMSSQATPVLVIRTQGSEQRLHAAQSYTVGRDPQCDIVVADSRVSWRHALVRLDHGVWIFEDAGSTNGTFLGNHRVNRCEISSDCVLRLGHPDDGPVVLCSVSRPDLVDGRCAPAP